MLELLKTVVWMTYLFKIPFFMCCHDIVHLGKFDKVVPAGFFCLWYPFESIAARISLKIQHLEVTCDTKTKDNVFVKVVVAGTAIQKCLNSFVKFFVMSCFSTVQYKVVEDKVPSAYYKLTDPKSQIRSYVFDVVRSSIPRMELDDAFASKDEVASAVKNQLSVLMAEYGYEIIAALVVDLDPNTYVKAAMNEINGTNIVYCAFV